MQQELEQALFALLRKHGEKHGLVAHVINDLSQWFLDEACASRPMTDEFRKDLEALDSLLLDASS